MSCLHFLLKQVPVPSVFALKQIKNDNFNRFTKDNLFYHFKYCYSNGWSNNYLSNLPYLIFLAKNCF